MATTTERAAKRYAQLVEILLAEEGGAEKYGAIARVARRLGISHSYASKIHHGDKSGISSDVIERAVKQLGLPRDFFYESSAPVSEYQTARQVTHVILDTNVIVEQFLSSPEGASVTPEHAERLRGIKFHLDGVDLTVGLVRDLWREMLAREAGRSAVRPVEVVERPGRKPISSTKRSRT